MYSYLQLLEKEVLSSDFFELVAAIVCEPSGVGFNVGSVEVMTHLPEVCVPLLKALVTSPYKENMECSIRKKVSPKRFVNVSYIESFFEFYVLLALLKIFTVNLPC